MVGYSFGSNAGYSSHFHNPFLALARTDSTESAGDVWGFSLLYSGWFTVEVEKSANGLVRTLLGLNDHQLSWPLQAGEQLLPPECVAVYSGQGVGGMSRRLHGLFRDHLIRSELSTQPRPFLLNSWEAVYFTFDENKVLEMARGCAELGAKLFVLDDGWFGVKHPRVDSRAGLGDWTPNPERFPNGVGPVIEKITNLPVSGSTSQEKLKFGIWVEPEMINVKSELYEEHPEWVLKAGTYPLTETRCQLVLNLALPEVQDYIIDFMSRIIEDRRISFLKWDDNRALHEVPSP